MKIVEKKIGELKLYKKNAKKHSQQQIDLITKSIKKFGFRQPIVIDKNKEIIIGHARLEAAKRLELKEVPVIDASDLTPQQVKALRLADNKLAELAQWDMGLVIEELKGLDNDLLDLTGWGKDLLIEPDAKDDVIPDSAPTRAKWGDIWRLGKHCVGCMDSTIRENVERLMNGKKADMVFTDPPYNVGYQGGGGYTAQKIPKRKKIIGDELNQNDFYEFLKLTCQNLINNCNGAIYICMGSKELHTLRKAFEEAGGHWQSFIIWVKNHFTISRADYQKDYEPILYGWRSGLNNHYFLDDRGKGNVWEDLTKVKTEKDGEYTIISFQGFKVRLKGKIESGEVIRHKQRIDIWRHNKPSASIEHPTMKPVALCQEAIINSSKENNIVLDLFLGSGSTLIAAEKTGRICYGCEIDPKYIDVIIKRWEDYTNKKAEKVI